MLNSPDVTHVPLWNVQLRNNSVVRSKCLVCSPDLSHLYQRLCHSSSVTHSFTYWGMSDGLETLKYNLLDCSLIGPLQSRHCGFMAKNVLVVQQFLWTGTQKNA